MSVRYRSERDPCPMCGDTSEVRIIVGFPTAKCVECGWNRA